MIIRQCRLIVRRASATALISAVFAATPFARAEDHSAAPNIPQGMSAAEIVDGMISSREKLHAGVCQARWKWQAKTNSYKETAIWLLYFDYDKGWSRIDRHLTSRPRDVIRIATPVEVIDYVPGPSGTITRQPPGAPALAEGWAFDVRVTGLVPLISMKGNRATWEKFLQVADHDRKASVENEPDGTLRLTWETIRKADAPGQDLHERIGHSFWLDPRRQFSPVRAEFFAGASPDRSGGERKVFAIIETEWIEHDGALVPKRCAWTEPIAVQTAELTFEWTSVNNSVTPALFTAEGLNAPKGTLIINSKQGESFIESIVGEEPPMKDS